MVQAANGAGLGSGPGVAATSRAGDVVVETVVPPPP